MKTNCYWTIQQDLGIWANVTYNDLYYHMTIKWNEYCFNPRVWYCTVRICWAGDNLVLWDEFFYESYPLMQGRHTTTNKITYCLANKAQNCTYCLFLGILDRDTISLVAGYTSKLLVINMYLHQLIPERLTHYGLLFEAKFNDLILSYYVILIDVYTMLFFKPFCP